MVIWDKDSKKMFEFIETFAINNKIYSIKADTNFDNVAMMKILDKLGYELDLEIRTRS
jgi:RimJ/RimL family protein N-acetyltransferase